MKKIIFLLLSIIFAYWAFMFTEINGIAVSYNFQALMKGVSAIIFSIAVVYLIFHIVERKVSNMNIVDFQEEE